MEKHGKEPSDDEIHLFSTVQTDACTDGVEHTARSLSLRMSAPGLFELGDEEE